MRNEWPGLGERIKDRLLQMGYVKDGRPDIMRFCDERRYRANYFYRWVNYGVTPDRANLDRIAGDLGVTSWWLLFGPVVDQTGPDAPKGRKRPVPTIRGGSASGSGPGRGIMSNPGRRLARARGRGRHDHYILIAHRRRLAA